MHRLVDAPRLNELHIPLSRFVLTADIRAWVPTDSMDQGPSCALTACGLSAAESELCFDMHFPVDEVRGMVVKCGWSW